MCRLDCRSTPLFHQDGRKNHYGSGFAAWHSRSLLSSTLQRALCASITYDRAEMGFDNATAKFRELMQRLNEERDPARQQELLEQAAAEIQQAEAALTRLRLALAGADGVATVCAGPHGRGDGKPD